jgi:hypothetical protein
VALRVAAAAGAVDILMVRHFHEGHDLKIMSFFSTI